MLSAELARYISELNYEDLPGEVVNAARIAVMDWLGSVLAGSQEEPAKMAASIIDRAGGNPQATLIGFERKSSALNAALLNGLSCHILELDDLHRSSILHPAAPIISAAAAAAEELEKGGTDFIVSLVAGFEVGIRIAEAVTPSHYYYWHTTATCGTFGAMAAAAKIYNLKPEEIVYALGNAGSQAAGLWEFLEDGAMTKHLHPGKAAMNGLLSAQLAGEGFTGASKILEGRKGFFRATAPQYHTEKVTEGLGREYRILGNSYKIYPSCRHTHNAVDLALKLRAGGLEPDTIDSIRVKTYSNAVDLVGAPDYSTPYKAKFSLPYCVARAFADGTVDLGSFDLSKPVPGRVKRLTGLCTVIADRQIEEAYPGKWAAAMEVKLKNGTVLTGRTDYPRGDPENPASSEDMQDKFRKLAARCWPEEKVEKSLEKLGRIEGLEHLGELFN